MRLVFKLLALSGILLIIGCGEDFEVTFEVLDQKGNIVVLKCNDGDGDWIKTMRPRSPEAVIFIEDYKDDYITVECEYMFDNNRYTTEIIATNNETHLLGFFK